MTRASADHPHTDPGDGRKECQTCGKWVFEAIHSCKRVPVTEAARRRWVERTGAVTKVDVDKLPPTQYLILEVLAARHRLGETLWPFPALNGPALRSLEAAGLITVMHGNAASSLRARLTEAGRKHVLAPGYVAPVARDFHSHACVSCSPDGSLPGPGCINCRRTGMDQTPCTTPGHQPQCPHGCCGGPRQPGTT